jgi:hypothetical protein
MENIERSLEMNRSNYEEFKFDQILDTMAKLKLNNELES